MTERLPTEQLADAGRAAGLTAALGGRYVVEREIGRGGMATVYLARDVRHKRPVALKVLDPELSKSLGVERFLREIELAARLTHPHILPVHDSGEAAGIIYYVMPFVEGESLRHRMDRATSTSRSALVARSRTHSRTHISRASSIATSSPRTCSCSRDTRHSPISA